jgi:hypothetical protein
VVSALRRGDRPVLLTEAYSARLFASGGSGGYGFRVVTGALPAQLTLSADGAFSGVPQQAGQYSFTVRVTDSDGNVGQRGFKLSVRTQRWLAYQVAPYLPPKPINLLDMNTAGYPVSVLPNAKSFSFSPDGNWIAYNTDTELDVSDVSSGTVGAPITLVSGASVDQFTWAPDSDWIGYHIAGPDTYYAVCAANGAQLTVGNMPPQFVVSRWGTRVVFEQCKNIATTFGATTWSCTASYASLNGVTPTAPPIPQTLATGIGNRGGWAGEQYYVFDADPTTATHSYATFGPNGIETIFPISTTLGAGVVLTAVRASPPIAFFSTVSAGRSTDPAYYPNLWFELDTTQRVERPLLGGDAPLSYAPSLTRFAIATNNVTAQIFSASQPQGPALGSVPITSGLTAGDSLLSWSPAEDLVGSAPGSGQPYVTWLDSSGTSLSVPGNFDSVQGIGGVGFGRHSDWVCFNGYTSDNVWHRWFSAIHGKTLSAVQVVGDTDYNGPAESPDSTLIAFHDGAGFNVVGVTAGVLGTPRQIIPIANRGYVAQQWSADSVHFVASVDATNDGNDQLFVVDVTTPTAAPKALGHSLFGAGGPASAAAMQP